MDGDVIFCMSPAAEALGSHLSSPLIGRSAFSYESPAGPCRSSSGVRHGCVDRSEPHWSRTPPSCSGCPPEAGRGAWCAGGQGGALCPEGRPASRPGGEGREGGGAGPLSVLRSHRPHGQDCQVTGFNSVLSTTPLGGPDWPAAEDSSTSDWAPHFATTSRNLAYVTELEFLKLQCARRGGGGAGARGAFRGARNRGPAQKGRPPKAGSCPARLSGPRRAPREAVVCGSGGACGNWGNLAPLRPPPEREKMPTHSGAGHDGRARAGVKLHFPAASSPPRQGKERAPAAGRASGSCQAPAGQPGRQSSRAHSRIGCCARERAGRNRLRLGPLAGPPANPRAERPGCDWAAGEAAS